MQHFFFVCPTSSTTDFTFWRSRAIPVFIASAFNSPSDAAGSEGGDHSDHVTCCSTSCFDLGDSLGLTDVCFFGTKSGDVISFCIRDVTAASPSPQKSQRRRSSIRAVASVALLGASMGEASHHAGLASAGFSRVMVCQRSICAIAANSRCPAHAPLSSHISHLSHTIHRSRRRSGRLLRALRAGAAGSVAWRVRCYLRSGCGR